MIFVTFNSLNATVATLRLPTEQMIVSRLIFVIIGAIITFIITYIFHYLYSKLIKKSNE